MLRILATTKTKTNTINILYTIIILSIMPWYKYLLDTGGACLLQNEMIAAACNKCVSGEEKIMKAAKT